jgi:hypothetical protein
MRERAAAVAVAVPFVLGSLAAPADGKDVVFRFQDPAIVEASGLVVRDGLFVTTNDSGDTGRIFTVDPATGRTVGVTSWPGAPEDVEALAPAGRDDAWVGDIGDNSRDRSSVTVTRLPVGAGDRDAAGETYELRYPDGPVDAETLLEDPTSGRVLIASKGILGGTLYAAPQRLRADRPNPVKEYGAILPIATDGAFFPDGRHLVLRDYGRAVIYSFPALEPVAELDLPDQEQGEAIAVDDDARVYVTSEGVDAAVLEVPLPRAVRAVVTAPEPTPSPSASPSPSPGVSREGRELPEEEPQGQRDAGQWLLGTVLFVAAVGVLLVAVRPRSSRRR